MGRLIVFNRPGIMVITGSVVTIDETGACITIEGDSPCNKKILVDVIMNPAQFENMKLTIGSCIVATIRPNETISAIRDGVFVPRCTVNAYNVRYNGAFDFKPVGKEEEAHVFCGSILRSASLPSGSLFLIGWKKNGKIEERRVFSEVDLKKSMGKKAILITGKPQPSKKGDVYFLKNYYNQ